MGIQTVAREQELLIWEPPWVGGALRGWGHSRWPVKASQGPLLWPGQSQGLCTINPETFLSQET